MCYPVGKVRFGDFEKLVEKVKELSNLTETPNNIF